MSRLMITLTVLVAGIVASSELQAQRRTPLRNLARNSGIHWSSGYHVRHPGPISDDYSTWTPQNTPDFQWRPAATQEPDIISYFEDTPIARSYPNHVIVPSPTSSASGDNQSASWRALEQQSDFIQEFRQRQPDAWIDESGNNIPRR